jgi:hypothetical protein
VTLGACAAPEARAEAVLDDPAGERDLASPADSPPPQPANIAEMTNAATVVRRCQMARKLRRPSRQGLAATAEHEGIEFLKRRIIDLQQ